MDFWNVVIDFGLASLLMLAAKVARVRVPIIQRLFIPSAMLAGLTGLVLGPFGLLHWIPWSAGFTNYAGVLITLVFAAVGLATEFPRANQLLGRVGSLWAFNQTATVSQWILGLVVGAILASTLWPGINAGFGLIMPAGFMGGHGTAVAIGQSFKLLGWNDAFTLALSSATFGIFSAVFLGMALLNFGVERGWIKRLPPFAQMDSELRRGLVPPPQQQAIAKAGVSSISLDVFALHAALILVVTTVGYMVSAWLSGLHQFIAVPKFACAFLVGCAIRHVLKRCGAHPFLDDRIFTHSASAATDYLIVFGVASIQVSVLITYALPMLILMLAGLVLCFVMVLYVAPRMLGDEWFERGIFSWGWMTGTVAMGILLLRVADPDMKSSVLDDYAIAYVPGAVVDILLISLMPFLVLHGYGEYTLIALLLYVVAVQIVAIPLRKAQHR